MIWILFDAIGNEEAEIHKSKGNDWRWPFSKLSLREEDNYFFQIYGDETFIDALWNALNVNHDKSIDQKELLICMEEIWVRNWNLLSKFSI